MWIECHRYRIYDLEINIYSKDIRKEIPDKITINTKNGPVDRIGYDLDHYPETWAERKVKLQSLETTPTRTEVLDCYNSDLRVQCHECNIKHIFEGVKGDFAE